MKIGVDVTYSTSATQTLYSFDFDIEVINCGSIFLDSTNPIIVSNGILAIANSPPEYDLIVSDMESTGFTMNY